MKKSSPIATSVALQYARAVRAPWNHPFIQNAMSYLNDVYSTYGFWPLKLETMNEEPHADWWHFDTQATTFEANPGAEIVGYFHCYPQVITDNPFPHLHDQAFSFLDSKNKPLEMHEALCYLRLAEMMPEPGKNQILETLKPQIREVVTLDPQLWDGYCAKPLWFAPHPESPCAHILEDVVLKNLDHEIEHQNEDGSWSPFWAWSQYENIWKSKVEKEWQGELTVKTLKALADYGRIEGLK
ncbi:hypothetical protein [Alteribacter populi]|uniref:hypothetical protein n=1 Tax=Alteribacter populi TaxID=2011011 RepID=UPI000BBAB51D|nr:hypothetical protein [Alteribacter populi]